MAASDVREILDIDPRSAVEALLSRPAKKPTTSNYRKRPEGISRELWGLISDKDGHDVSLVPTEAPVNEYKRSKARIGKSSRVRKWRWVPFQNSARTDGAIFYHYRRAGEPETDYAFAKFNKKLELPTYTDEEYSRLLQNSEWSREETDYLWSMLAAFDLRWVVIHDRWRFGEPETDVNLSENRLVNTPKVNIQTGRRETPWKTAALSKPRRSIEDMKERFYGICAALAKHRGTLNDPSASASASVAPASTSTNAPATQSENDSAGEKTASGSADASNAQANSAEAEKAPNPSNANEEQPAQATASGDQAQRTATVKTNVEVTRWLNEVVAFPYDAEHERKRKEQLDRLLNRTRAEEEEEEELIVALKRIEQRRKDTEKELDKLIGTQSHPAPASTSEASRNRPHVHAHHAHAAATPGAGSSLGASALADANRKKQKQKVKKVGVVAQSDTPAAAAPATQRTFPDPDAKAPAGVGLQSNRQRCPNSVAQKRARAVEQVLTELGLDPAGILSFRELVREYNDLREDVLRLIDLKVALGNAEFENTTLRHRYDKIAPRQNDQEPSNAAQAEEAPAAPTSAPSNAEEAATSDFGSPQKLVSDAVDVNALHSTRKRRAPTSSPVTNALSTSPSVLTRSHNAGSRSILQTGDDKMDTDQN